MSDETKTPKRKVEKHTILTNDRTDGKIYSAWPSFGGKLPEGEVLHKFEIRLPIPRTIEELTDLYGYTAEQAFSRFVKAVWTDMDNEVKAKLFDGCEAPGDAAMVEEQAHQAAQAASDEWRYTPRKAGRKTTDVASVVAALVAGGVLDESALGEVKTAQDLERAIALANG